MVPYLTVRGRFSEAGMVIRRNLESLGVLTHFWSDPSKAAYLEDSDSRRFRFCICPERDKKIQNELRQKAIRKRFAAFHSFAGPASELYKLLSGSDLHGGTPLNVVLALAHETSVSCGFIDRRDPGDEMTLALLHKGTERLCVETTALHGQFGSRYGTTPPMVAEGDRLLRALLSPVDSPSQEMARELAALQEDLGVCDHFGHVYSLKRLHSSALNVWPYRLLATSALGYRSSADWPSDYRMHASSREDDRRCRPVAGGAVVLWLSGIDQPMRNAGIIV